MSGANAGRTTVHTLHLRRASTAVLMTVLAAAPHQGADDLRAAAPVASFRPATAPAFVLSKPKASTLIRAADPAPQSLARADESLLAKPSPASAMAASSATANSAADFPAELHVTRAEPLAIADAGVAASQPIAQLDAPDPGADFAAVPQKEAALTGLSLPPADESPAYVGQISDTARAAYIAQVTSPAAQPRMALRSGNQLLGEVEFQAADGGMSVHIGQVLDLFESEMDPVQFSHLRSSSAAGEFVSLDRLRSAGIPIAYNAAYDELVLQPGAS